MNKVQAMTATDITSSDIPAAERSTAGSQTALEAKILVTLLAAVVAWGASVAIWGIPGLYIPALALVPVVWGILLLISRI